MKIILSGKVTGINGTGTPSIEIKQARINHLEHDWKLGEKVFIEIDVNLTDIMPPSEINAAKS